MREHWTLDSVSWDKFDRSKLEPEMVRLMKAASLVEYNATDYVEYLHKVFAGDEQVVTTLRQWGAEEVQHGQALAKWAELADPSFNFKESFERFRTRYRPPHFINAEGSVRGSRIGELIARCVVECGTSSSYTALRDHVREPVLKQIAGLIAADEFKHYRLFYDLMGLQKDPKPNLFIRMWIAVTRVSETEDDELAMAYYCANVAAQDEAKTPYDRKACNDAYQSAMFKLYGRGHVQSAIGMIAKAIGLRAESLFVRLSTSAVWQFLRLRTFSSRRVTT